MQPNVHMAVDSRNLLYKCIYSAKITGKSNYVEIFLKQLTTFMNIIRPTHVHVCWDAPRTNVWRRKILPTYKDRDTAYTVDITDDLKHTSAVLTDILSDMNVRQYYIDTMEADDLIYALVMNTTPDEITVVSTDSDMIQLPFYYKHCKLYNPSDKKYIEPPKHSPTVLKALVGDKTDVIDGYFGIGPVKGTAMANDIHSMQEFFDIKGRKIFDMNFILIDLSMCPKVNENRLYAHRIMATKTKYDDQIIKDKLRSNCLHSVLSIYHDVVYPFKNLR